MTLLDFSIILFDSAIRLFKFAFRCLMFGASKALDPGKVGVDNIDRAVNLAGAFASPFLFAAAGFYGFFAFPIGFLLAMTDGIIEGAKSSILESRRLREEHEKKKSAVKIKPKRSYLLLNEVFDNDADESVEAKVEEPVDASTQAKPPMRLEDYYYTADVTTANNTSHRLRSP